MRQNDNPIILVADDDPSFREAFRQMLEIRGYQTAEAKTTEEVIAAVGSRKYDLLTLDLEWEREDKDGVGLLTEISALNPLLPVVMITGYATIPSAVEATRRGAFDFIEKTANREKILLTIRNAIETGRLRRENQAFLNEALRRYELIGVSTHMVHIRKTIATVAPTESAVLITGESGTGKELIARQIHLHSRRYNRTFIKVDSGTLADALAESDLFGHKRGAFTGASQDRKGLFEEADSGTIFLDEISNASTAVQQRLLRILEEGIFRRVGENTERSCDVRVIAATNQYLPTLIEKGKFRNDLYFRLNEVEISIPPLRERKTDIPKLVEHFLNVKSGQISDQNRQFSPEALGLLYDHDWPGNVRELEHAITRIIIMSMGEVVSADEIKSILGGMWLEKASSLKSLNEMTRDFRRECILKALGLADGQITKAAELLQIDRSHLHKLINEYHLKDR